MTWQNFYPSMPCCDVEDVAEPCIWPKDVNYHQMLLLHTRMMQEPQPTHYKPFCPNLTSPWKPGRIIA